MNTNWGTTEQPFYRPGANPTVDTIILRDGRKEKEVLLIRRSPKAGCEPGKWALPGGFHDSASPKGVAWTQGHETAIQAAKREVQEETGLTLSTDTALLEVGSYEGNKRDPRDNATAWSKTTAFIVDLGATVTPKVRGMDDADRAKWIPLSKVPTLAFDHSKILNDGLRKLNIAPSSLSR